MPNKNNLSFNHTERAWLKSLINSDINNCKELLALPVDDVGQMAAAFTQLRIENMRSLLFKLEAADAVESQNASRKIKRRTRSVPSLSDGDAK